MSEYIERETAINAMLHRYWDGQETLREIMNSVPAADVEPVAHGYNMDNAYSGLFTCSVCGWACGDTTHGDTETYNYCPNCGAKMNAP